MSALAAQNLIHSEAQDIDADCWNRIGIYGTRAARCWSSSIHCWNCAVSFDAATRLLDQLAHLKTQETIRTQCTTGRMKKKSPRVLAGDFSFG